MLYGRISGALALVALVVIGTVVVAGCGGGEDTAEATATSSKAEFTKQAHAVCAENRKEREAVLARFYKKPSKGNEEAALEALLEESLLPLLQKELKALEDLAPPEADQATVDQMLQSLARNLEEIEERGAAVAGDYKFFSRFEKEAEDYGLDCAIV